MPRLQNRVRRDIDGQFVRVDVVINIGKTFALHALADYESVCLEDGGFLRIKPKVMQASILKSVRGVPDCGSNAVEIPEFCRRWIEGELREILIRRRVRCDKIFQGKLPELLHLLTERGAVAKDRVAEAVPGSCHFHIRRYAIENVTACSRYRDAQKFIGHSNTPRNRSGDRGPVHHVAALLDDILGIHRADGQRHLRMHPNFALSVRLFELKCDLIRAKGRLTECGKRDQNETLEVT